MCNGIVCHLWSVVMHGTCTPPVLPRSKLLLKIFRRGVEVARSESGELSKDRHRPSSGLVSISITI